MSQYRTPMKVGKRADIRYTPIRIGEEVHRLTIADVSGKDCRVLFGGSLEGNMASSGVLKKILGEKEQTK